jgi:hypothetical protein
VSAHDLLLAVRATIRADSDPARQALFRNLTRASPSARIAERVHAALGRSVLSTLMVSLYGVWTYLATACDDVRRPVLLTVAVHSNARHQVNRVAAWFRGQTIAQVRLGTRALRPWATILSICSIFGAPRVVFRVLRVLHRINARSTFLVSCRSASTIAGFVRARGLLAALRPGAVVVSSDTNPDEIAFVAAARGLAIPTVYISHAYPSPFSPPLRFDLSILEGDAAVDARRARGPIQGEIVLLGVEGESRPLDPRRFSAARPVIGLCLPKVVAWPVLSDIVRDCRDVFDARDVLIRWHPSMLELAASPIARTATAGTTTTPPEQSLRDFALRCDWIVADANSNVHLQVLKLGVPTVAVDALGVMAAGRSDLYGFSDNRILFPPVASLRDLSGERLLEFYGGDWSTRFTRYDAAYMQSAAEMAARATAAITRVIARSGWAS